MLTLDLVVRFSYAYKTTIKGLLPQIIKKVV